jgi:hypothetical protein
VLPLQQPFGQVVEPQGVHTPLEQVSPLLQAAQAAPAVPQDPSVWFPVATQPVLSQQPFGQEEPSHGRHTPLAQASPALHAAQATPPVPHWPDPWLA